MIKKELGEIDWTKPAEELECLIRGLNPWPSAYTKLKGKTLKIWKAYVEESSKQTGCQEAGTIIESGRAVLIVQTGQGSLKLLEVKLEGKKRMETDAFLRGYPVENGTRLGKEW